MQPQEQEKYGIDNHVSFSLSSGNLTKVLLRLTAGTTAEIFLHGAHVTSFVDETGNDVLFMSAKSSFDRKKAIRGGIPVIFPQFGPGELPQHGFARTELWTVKKTTASPDGNEASITLELRSNEATKAVWPQDFVFLLTTKITFNPLEKSRLSQELEITNTGSQPFRFTTALHTYFAVNDVKAVKVAGLNKLTYFDKVKKSTEVQEVDLLSLSGPTDSIYYNAPDKIFIAEGKSKVVVEKSNFPDVVVWNCWAEGAKGIADLCDEAWEKYICCETAAIRAPVVLEPQQSWTASQVISKVRDNSKY